MQVDRWDCEGAPRPQAPAFLAWARRHLDAEHPVIFCVYQTKVDGDDEYDHIVLATGYDTDAESGAFRCLRYMDMYLDEHLCLERVCTRAECAHHEPDNDRGDYAFEYSLPKTFISAMAVTGILGAAPNAPRVQLDVGRWNEPECAFQLFKSCVCPLPIRF